MINRKSKHRPEGKPVIIIDDLEADEASAPPSKGSHDNKGRSRVEGYNNFGACRLLLFVCCVSAACFLLYVTGVAVGRRISSIELHEEIDYLSNADDVRLRKKPNFFPNGWEEYSYDNIRRHFKCNARSLDDSKALPSMEDWNFMRRIYTQVVDNKKKWDDDPMPPTMGYSLEKGTPVPPPFFPKASPGKGRGLFASRFIRKGELVHDGTHSDVVFPDALAWRRFVFSLGSRDLACDCTDWLWMQMLDEGGRYFMLGALNISSLMNSGGSEFGPGRGPNAMPESKYSGRFYATRDIEKYEEILTDYEAYYTNWKEIGL